MIIYSDSQNPKQKIISMGSFTSKSTEIHYILQSSVLYLPFYCLLRRIPSPCSGFPIRISFCFYVSHSACPDFPLNLTSLLPLFSVELPSSPLLAIIWKYVRCIYCTVFVPFPLIIKKWVKSSAYTSLQELNSVIFVSGDHCPSGAHPLRRGPSKRNKLLLRSRALWHISRHWE